MENNKEKIITKLKPIVFFLCLMLIGGWGCSARKGVPYSEPLSIETHEVKQGQVLFNNYCSPCHPGGTSGLGPALNNKPLPKFMIRFQIRNGLGVMPAFKEEVLTDEQVKNIADYMVYLRKKG